MTFEKKIRKKKILGNYWEFSFYRHNKQACRGIFRSFKDEFSVHILKKYELSTMTK